MALDLLALCVLASFALVGAWRGAVAGLISLASLLCSYAAGVLAALRLGPMVAPALGVPLWVGAPLAGSVAFAVVFFVCAVGGIWVCRWDRRRVKKDGRSARDRLGGACFGALRGALVVLLIGVLTLWLDAARVFSGAESRAEASASTPLRRATRAVVATGVELALGGGPGAVLAAKVLADPAETLTQLQHVLQHPRIATLGGDREFWSDVEHGAVDTALSRGSFVALLHDAALRRELAELGLMEPAAAGDPAAFRQATRDVLVELGPRLRRIHSDPEVLALAHDPEIAGLLEAGEVVELIQNPRFTGLVARALREPESG